MSVITPGFTGYAALASDSQNRLRFNSWGVVATQDIEAPDMVMGDYTHNAWAYGKIEVGGSVSGPVTENTMKFVKEVWGSDANNNIVPQDINVKFYNQATRQYKGMVANQLTINVSAGEVAQFTLDLMGVGVSTDGNHPTMTDAYSWTEKLVTWDKASFYVAPNSLPASNDSYTSKGNSVLPGVGGVNLLPNLESFSMTFSNNLSRQFIIKGSDLFGDLVRGMSAITGSLTSYQNLAGSNFGSRSYTGSGVYFWDQYQAHNYYPFSFSLGGGNDERVNGTVAFSRSTTELSTGPVMSNITMTGVGHYGKLRLG